MDFTTNIPLSRIKTEKTENRILNIFKGSKCIVYSKYRNQYMSDNGWTSNLNYAYISSFPEWYEKTKALTGDDIIYKIVVNRK